MLETSRPASILGSFVKAQALVVSKSPFVRNALILLVTNTLSRAVGFFGSAYAARCLGPSFFGTSALIQTTAQQAALGYNGGFDLVAVRRIAGRTDSPTRLPGMIVAFRLSIACILSVLWLVGSIWFAPSNQKAAWLLGIPILIMTAGTVAFAFQGLERLPIQNTVTAVGALLSAVLFFSFFSPGMFLGADLLVTGSVGLLMLIMSWGAFHRVVGCFPVATIDGIKLRALLAESKRYWILAVLVYFYSTFQLTLVAFFTNPHDAGLFRSAFLMAAGVELLFNSINSLLLARLVAWRQLGLENMWRRQRQLFLTFTVLGVPFVIALIAAAPSLFRILLGESYSQAVEPFKLLVVGRLIVFLGQIYALGLAAAEEDEHFVIASLLGAIVNISLNVILLPRYGIVGAAGVSLLSEVAVHGYCFLVSWRLVAHKLGYGRTT
jgi:O-antigen/teichoic acid export membrane protein